jgi:hypothetical protein
MKTLNIALLSLAVGAAVLAPVADADARGRHHHHHHHGSVGVFFGAPLFPYYSPYWYPRYYYPPAVVAAPAPAPTYIEQNATGAYGPPAQQNAYWYFCPDSQTYYPYVQQCASQWQQVQPQASATPQ